VRRLDGAVAGGDAAAAAARTRRGRQAPARGREGACGPRAAGSHDASQDVEGRRRGASGGRRQRLRWPNPSRLLWIESRQGRSAGMRARPGAAAPRGGALGEPRTARARVRDPRSPGKNARRRGEGGGDSAEPRAAGGAARSGQAAGGEEEQRRPVGSGHHARSRGADSGGGRTRAAGRRTAGSRGEAGGRVRRELDPRCRGLGRPARRLRRPCGTLAAAAPPPRSGSRWLLENEWGKFLAGPAGQ